MPPRFKPRGHGGVPMRGPYTTKNGKPWNLGRQFYSSDDGDFLWADGSVAMG